MEPKRKKIILISVISIIIIVIVFIFIRSRQQNVNQEGNTGFKKFLDLGSLFTGKRQTPDGISQPNNNSKEDSSNNEDENNINNGKNTPFVVAGLPTPTPIAQNIGGGFGTNDINLIPNGENPNNCIDCNSYPSNPINPTDQPGSESGFSSVFINAAPSSIHKNDEVTVSWDSYNVNVCTASSFPVITGWNSRVAKTGNKSFEIKTPTTFVIKCTTDTTSVQASDSVSIVPDEAPVCDTNNCSTEDPIYKTLVSVVMEASPYLVDKNTTSNITWDSENAASCNAHSIPQKDDWKGLIGDNEGDANVLLGEEPTTYVLTCTDGKTTGQTDVTISVDTSGIGDEKIKDDPVDLCTKEGEEENPLCKARDIDYEEEIKMLILTEEEESRLEALMKEVAIMSPTLPSNQTASSVEISTRTYEQVLKDVNINVGMCYELIQNTDKNQDLVDALWERQIIGRRRGPGLEYLEKKYPINLPSQKLLKKYYDYARLPGNEWRHTGKGEGETDCPGRRITTIYKNDVNFTFIFPWLADDCWIMNSYKTKETNAQKGIYDKVPGYGRMQEQVEYGSDSKGVKIY